MKILITGGGGFVGRYVIRELLAEGHQVVAYQRSPSPELEGEGVQVRQGSILSSDGLGKALSGCDAVIHVAAKAGVWGPSREYFSTNVEGTQLLLEAMERAGVKKLVYCSSPSVVFNGGSFDGDDESLPYGSNWLCPYPESKAIAEQITLEWGRNGKGTVIALRPHLIWGKGDPHLLPPVIRRSQSGQLRVIGSGTNRIDTTRVENVARAHLLALKALDRPTAVNRPYFISQADPVVLWDWLNAFLRRLELPAIQKQVSLPTAYGVGAICEGVWKILGRQSIPPMTRFIALEMARSHWFSIDAARQELGYHPEDFPTEEGIDRYVDAWKKGQTPT